MQKGHNPLGTLPGQAISWNKSLCMGLQGNQFPHVLHKESVPVLNSPPSLHPLTIGRTVSWVEGLWPAMGVTWMQCKDVIEQKAQSLLLVNPHTLPNMD